MPLFTAGYEGVNIEQFCAALEMHEVEMLIDVRGNPISRKPGFSMNALRRAVEARDIGYQHWKALGCPRDILLDYRADSDWAAYTEKFWRYLRTREEDIERLAELAQEVRCCLVCFEADANYCHRSYVAQFTNELALMLSITHIDVKRATSVVTI